MPPSCLTSINWYTLRLGRQDRIFFPVPPSKLQGMKSVGARRKNIGFWSGQRVVFNSAWMMREIGGAERTLTEFRGCAMLGRPPDVLVCGIGGGFGVSLCTSRNSLSVLATFNYLNKEYNFDCIYLSVRRDRIQDQRTIADSYKKPFGLRHPSPWLDSSQGLVGRDA